MIQVVLLFLGAYFLFVKNIRIAKGRVIARPGSLYLGAIVIAFVSIFGLIGENLWLNIAYFLSLAVIIIGFVSKASTASPEGGDVSGAGERASVRNLILLLVAALAIGGYFYWWLNVK